MKKVKNSVKRFNRSASQQYYFIKSHEFELINREIMSRLKLINYNSSFFIFFIDRSEVMTYNFKVLSRFYVLGQLGRSRVGD